MDDVRRLLEPEARNLFRHAFSPQSTFEAPGNGKQFSRLKNTNIKNPILAGIAQQKAAASVKISDSQPEVFGTPAPLTGCSAVTVSFSPTAVRRPRHATLGSSAGTRCSASSAQRRGDPAMIKSRSEDR